MGNLDIPCFLVQTCEGLSIPDESGAREAVEILISLLIIFEVGLQYPLVIPILAVEGAGAW